MIMEKKKPKVNVNIESLFIGDEPTFGDPKTEIGIARSLSWYSGQFGPKESKKYTLEYVRNNKYSKEIVSKLTSVDEELFKNIGFVCRMVSRGAQLGFDKINYLDERIDEIVNYSPDSFVSSITSSAPQPTKPERSIQDRVYDQATHYINEIEGHVDSYIKTRKSDFKCYDMLKSFSVKPIYINQIKEHYASFIAELQEAVKGKDEQLVEAYSHWSKKELKAFLEFMIGIISDCENYAGNAKTVRKPRKKKVVPLEKKVSSVKYQKESVEYKIVSISPTEILGATQLWVFNTKYKQLGLYKAEDDAGFGIKGTTITGFDENLSMQKTLRKPLETLESFKKAKKIELKKFLSTLSTKESKLNGRINSDTVVLKVVK